MRDEFAALAQCPLVKGVRRILQGESDPNFCLSPDFIGGGRALAEFNLEKAIGFRAKDAKVAKTELYEVGETLKGSPTR